MIAATDGSGYGRADAGTSSKLVASKSSGDGERIENVEQLPWEEIWCYCVRVLRSGYGRADASRDDQLIKSYQW